MRNSVRMPVLNPLFLLIVSMLSCVNLGISQESAELQSGLYIKAKAIDKGIELRWAPTDAATWIETRETGYYLLRIEHKASGAMDSTWLFSQPFKPKSLEELKATVDQKNKYIAIAAQAMYGEDFSLSDRAPKGEIEAMSMAHDMLQMRFFFALQAADFSKEAADVLTLRWVDQTAEKGAYYSYIILNDTVSKNPKIRGGITDVYHEKIVENLTPQGLTAYPKDKQIELQWLRAQVGDFTTFYVERSDDGGKTYKRLNEDPYFTSFNEDDLENTEERVKGIAGIMQYNHVYIDSIPQNYKDYYYRIRGIDAFADVTDPSETIKVQGIDLTPPKAVEIVKLNNIFQNHVLIEWETPKAMELDMAGYRMKRGHDPQGPFYDLNEQILPKNTTSFLDTTANGMHANYYVLSTEDSHGNYSYSFPRLGILMDTIAPKHPEGLIGIIDTTGLVYLKWEHNKEADLKGYKVYKSYDLSGSYPQVTSYSISENGYIDTIDVRSLDRKIYYKIVAVDRNGNHSMYSEAFELNKPILNAPTTPVIQKIYTQNFQIYLEIIGSRSEGVAAHQIYRKTGNKTWDTLATIALDKNRLNFQYIDTTVNPKTQYSYAVEAVDETGIRSAKSHPFSLTIFENKPLQEVQAFQAKYNPADRTVKLSWNFPDHTNIYFVIYKAEDNGRLRALTSVENVQEFVDVNVGTGNVQYAIKAIHKETKAESKRSDSVQVLVGGK